jgi:hypothetical protein
MTLASIKLDRSREGCRYQWQKWGNEHKHGPVPESKYTIWNEPLRTEGNALILGDLEAPFQHADFVNKCLAVARAWGIENLILGGDAVHFASLSSFAPEFAEQEPNQNMSEDLEAELLALASEIPEAQRAQLTSIMLKHSPQAEPGVSGELAEVRDCFRGLERQFKRIDYIIGNHEARLLRALERALSAVDLMALLHNGDRWRIAPYFFSYLVSGGVEWKITHPKNYAKGSSKKLADVLNCNIIQLHGHYFSLQMNPANTFIGIEPGCCVDERRLQYEAGRDTTHDRHTLGAVMIVNGKPHLLNEITTDWTWMLKT